MLSKEPLISVIIPAFNIEKYIKSCIDSILSQTYRNLEIIIVNDGSTDSTSFIIDQCAKEDIRINVYHKENGGVTSARLLGVKKAHGDWIGFVDGDDWIEPEMYERLLKNAMENQADISHCGYQMVFSDHVDYYYGTKQFSLYDHREALKELLGGRFEPSLGNKLYTKSLVMELVDSRVIQTDIKINEDLLMNYYLFDKSKTSVFEDLCLYHYQVRKGSAATSSTNIFRYRDPILVGKILSEETKRDKELYIICISALVEKLIRVSTLQFDGKEIEIKECILEAREELQRLLPEIRRESRFSLRIKLLSEMASFSPSFYNCIHTFYKKIKGNYHKYDV